MIGIVLVIILLLLLGINYYFYWYRNDRVCEFRKFITNLCYEHNNRNIGKDNNFWIDEKYSYEQMMYSFKPLKLSVWFTKEEIERLI